MRLSRRYWIPSLVAAVVVAAYAFLHAGTFLAREDELTRADAILVLAGTRVERPLEGADLFREGYAPVLVLTQGAAEGTAIEVARKQGATVLTDIDSTRTLLEGLGIPPAALVVPSRLHDNTAEEIETLRHLARIRGWTRVIVVSSKYHLRRVRLASGRAFRGTGIQIMLRGSRYDPSTPERWWRRRGDIRWLASEMPKLLGYALGAG